jgi:hypothetical protein
MKQYEHLPDEEYVALLQVIVAYCVLKHYNGILVLAQSTWESGIGSVVGGSLNITFDEDTLTVTVAGVKDAEA